jgi:RHS repeat-associated protein
VRQVNLTYSYDADGRVISQGGSLASVAIPAAMTATYDSKNQLASYDGTNAQVEAVQNSLYGTIYNDDLLAFDPSNNGSYTWNERHQLASASVGGTGSTLQYDALGRRVQQSTGTTIDNYVNDGLNAVQIQSSMSGNIDILSGLWLDDWFASADSTGSVALLENALGSTIALVNSGGSLATQDTYEPFGKTTTSGASTTNLYAFAGREQDASGLYFMRARYYNPLLSRFISSDPIGLSGGQANFFACVGNSPMNFTDPTGEVWGGSQPAPSNPPCTDCVGNLSDYLKESHGGPAGSGDNPPGPGSVGAGEMGVMMIGSPGSITGIPSPKPPTPTATPTFVPPKFYPMPENPVNPNNPFQPPPPNFKYAVPRDTAPPPSPEEIQQELRGRFGLMPVNY